MKKPKAPDPVATAQAQSAMNRDTAISEQLINMVNTSNPWGSTAYNQTGTTGYRDSSGKWVTIPTFTQTTTLSPEQQAIYDAATQAETNLANIASDQSARISETLSDPFEFNNQDAANWAYDLGSQRLDPRFAREEDALRSRLTNQGIREGTAAWNNAMGRLSEGKNDAYNQLMLQGRGQAFSEALTTRNQPINELMALLGGTQVDNPAAMSAPTPQAGVAGVDYAGLVQSDYQQRMQNHGSMLGGLFGLAGTLAPFALSDERAKENIERVGETDGGLPLYRYNYKGETETRFGPMAQEVDREQPQASGPSLFGLRTVNYGAIQ